MLGPAFSHLDRVSLEGSQQIKRIETGVQRALPRLDDRLPPSSGQLLVGLRLKLTKAEQAFPALTKLSSVGTRVQPRCNCQPLRRHDPPIVAPSRIVHRTPIKPGHARGAISLASGTAVRSVDIERIRLPAAP